MDDAPAEPLNLTHGAPLKWTPRTVRMFLLLWGAEQARLAAEPAIAEQFEQMLTALRERSTDATIPE